jgi:DNA (cytosine-5)-methyltransferase 1
MNPEITLLDLFSGIGGFASGLEDAGFTIKKHYFSEIEKNAIANYRYNFPDAENIGSVRDVRHIVRTIERPNIITFGSPCQDFSVAGKRSGLGGQRSNLIRSAIFLVRWFKPDFFIWENVKGAYSTNDGADFWAIIKAFANIDGYGFEQQLVNTAWVLPQNRERIYIVGYAGKAGKQKIFPLEKVCDNLNGGGQKSVSKGEIAATITAGGNSGGLHSGMNLVMQVNTSKESGGRQPFQQNRVYDPMGISACKQADMSSKTHAVLLGKRVKVNTPAGNTGALTAGGNKTGNNSPYIGINNKVRRLTEIECERLQGYPDNWTKWGMFGGKKKEIAMTRRYKLLGNAVTRKIVSLIGARILKATPQ